MRQIRRFLLALLLLMFAPSIITLLSQLAATISEIEGTPLPLASIFSILFVFAIFQLWESIIKNFTGEKE